MYHEIKNIIQLYIKECKHIMIEYYKVIFKMIWINMQKQLFPKAFKEMKARHLIQA